jgi:hypothetical protein
LIFTFWRFGIRGFKDQRIFSFFNNLRNKKFLSFVYANKAPIYPLHHRCRFSDKGKLCLPQVLQHGGGPQQYKQRLSSTIKKTIHYLKLNFDLKMN